MAIADPATVVLACEAMATRFELILCGDDRDHLQAAGEAAVDEIEDAHRRLSAYDPASVVSAINRAAGTAPVRIDSEVFDLLQTCNTVRAESDGAFDAAIGGTLKLDRAASTAFLTETDSRLDLGAIGKGFGIDRAADVLRDAGMTSALIHGGTSTTLAIGARPDGEPWRIGLSSETAEAITIPLCDTALSRSDRIEASARSAAHIIDPLSGKPARGACAAAVVHSTATLADAWSTAAVVAGTAPDGIAWAALGVNGWTLSDTLTNHTDPQEK
ncbi:MAG: FAD:protein FMN transferase [Planctomycetota bacterium]